MPMTQESVGLPNGASVKDAGICRLCGSDAGELKQSHIIPKFVGRWMKNTSITPYFRSGGNADKRIQDLPSMELLCGRCENLFSAWERKFATEIFYPSTRSQMVFWYDSWLLKFAASLAWRAIQVDRLEREEPSPALKSKVEEMELHLSRFLLGSERNVGSYTQHIYQVSELAAPVTPGSPMLNRYLARAVEVSLLPNEDLSEVLVYVKLPMFMFFCVGESRYRKRLETSRIKKSGLLRPRDHVPHPFMVGLILQRSDELVELFRSMSPKSKALADKAVQEAIEQDPDRAANSRLMRAITADYEFYGKRALED